MADGQLSGAEVCALVREAGFPAGSFVVCGSAALAARGIRDAGDVDLVVSPELYASLKASGWQERHFPDPGRSPALFEVPFDAATGWGVGDYQPTLAELLAESELIAGVPFVSLAALARWKRTCGRPKDLTDVELIERVGASARRTS